MFAVILTCNIQEHILKVIFEGGGKQQTNMSWALLFWPKQALGC